MEELLIVFLQIFFEGAIQFFGAVPLNLSSGNRLDKGCGWVALHTVFGGILGFVSTLISPTLILQYAALRIANLFLAPVLAGGVSYGIGTVLKARGLKSADPHAHMIHAVLFAFMFGAARFAFAKH